MKQITFTYTDLKDKVSTRTLLAMSVPSNKYAGIDISELSNDEAKDFSDAYFFEYGVFLNEIEKLKTAYDLRHSYRRFIDERMTNVKDISA
jgi:hypothetical protein